MGESSAFRIAVPPGTAPNRSCSTRPGGPTVTTTTSERSVDAVGAVDPRRVAARGSRRVSGVSARQDECGPSRTGSGVSCESWRHCASGMSAWHPPRSTSWSIDCSAARPSISTAGGSTFRGRAGSSTSCLRPSSVSFASTAIDTRSRTTRRIGWPGSTRGHRPVRRERDRRDAGDGGCRRPAPSRRPRSVGAVEHEPCARRRPRDRQRQDRDRRSSDLGDRPLRAAFGGRRRGDAGQRRLVPRWSRRSDRGVRLVGDEVRRQGARPSPPAARAHGYERSWDVRRRTIRSRTRSAAVPWARREVDQQRPRRSIRNWRPLA